MKVSLTPGRYLAMSKALAVVITWERRTLPAAGGQGPEKLVNILQSTGYPATENYQLSTPRVRNAEPEDTGASRKVRPLDASPGMQKPSLSAAQKPGPGPATRHRPPWGPNG